MKIDEYDAVSTFERIKAEFKEESFLNYLNQHGKKQFLAEVIESDADCLKEVFDDLFYCRDELGVQILLIYSMKKHKKLLNI